MTSTCSGKFAHNSFLGEYEEICRLEDGKVVYGHAESSTLSYLYYLTAGNQWLVSSQIGDSVASIGTSSLQHCPEDVTASASSKWNVYTGQVKYYNFLSSR